MLRSSIALLLLLAPTLALAPTRAHAQDPDAPKPQPRVTLTVSVDWEGRDLTEENLRAFEKLRAAHPGVPFTHFLSAGYLTRPGVDLADQAKRMNRVLRPGDEKGHHVHMWRSLVEAAGVVFRSDPRWTPPGTPLHEDKGDAGHEVYSEAYTKEEIQKIVREGVKRLRDAGFEISKSYRGGGWVTPPHLLEAIRAEGFEIDSSATDSSWLKDLDRWGYSIPKRLREVWTGITEKTQPFFIETPAGKVLEMPDTGNLADYVTSDQMVTHVKRAIEEAKATGKEVFVHIGFHQETAARYSPRVLEAIERIRALDTGGLVHFETLEQAAPRARIAAATNPNPVELARAREVERTSPNGVGMLEGLVRRFSERERDRSRR